MVINNHHHTREEQKQTTHDDTTLRPPRAPLWSPFASLARDAFGLCGEIRIEILSFAWNENEEFEIRGPPGPLRRPCPPRMPASDGAERPLTDKHTHEEPLDRKPAPNALGRRCRTAERPGPGRRLSFHDLNETKSARARERGEPIVAGRAERYVRIVTRLRFYRDVIEHVAARKSRAREPLRRVLGPPRRRSSKRAIRLFPLAARMTSVDVDVHRSRRQAPRPARAQNRLVPLRRR